MDKQNRVRVDGPASSLTSNPFTQLKVTPCEKSDAGTSQTPPPETSSEKKAQARFCIKRTKKGGFPLFLEKRAAGKSVTIIRNITGDTSALLTLLKKHCAAGGKAFPDSVEIQGDHCKKIEKFLQENGL